MSEKFHKLRAKFASMYNSGMSYEEICNQLRISPLTAFAWRKKLGLPPRRHSGAISWMDEKRMEGESPREILERIARDLTLGPNDIELILVRFDKLRSSGVARGRKQRDLILASAFLYVRWPGSDRQPVSAKTFVDICGEAGYQIDRRSLLMNCRLFQERQLYPAIHLKPREFLERKWNHLKREYSLTEEVKILALKLIEVCRLVKSPGAVAAAAIYLAAPRCSLWIAQRDLAHEFGVTEVTVRNVKNAIEATIPEEQFRRLSQGLEQSTKEELA